MTFPWKEEVTVVVQSVVFKLRCKKVSSTHDLQRIILPIVLFVLKFWILCVQLGRVLQHRVPTWKVTRHRPGKIDYKMEARTLEISTFRRVDKRRRLRV